MASRHAPSVYLARLSPGSRHSQRIALERIASLLSDGASDFHTFPWSAVGYEHTAALQSLLLEPASNYKPATVRRMMAALKGTLKAAWRLQQISTDDYHRAVDLAPVKAQSLPRGHQLSGREIRSLFDECADDPDVTGPRDAALFSLLFGAGLRRFEVVELILDDYDPTTGALQVQRGKGNKGRVAYLGASARDCLDYWLDFRGRKPGALLHPTTPGGRILRRKMNAQTVMDRCRLRGAQAKIRPFTPHDARRTFISNLLDEGHDIATVQQLAGHSSPKTTSGYDRRGETTKRKAAESVLIPFKRPGSSH